METDGVALLVERDREAYKPCEEDVKIEVVVVAAIETTHLQCLPLIAAEV